MSEFDMGAIGSSQRLSRRSLLGRTAALSGAAVAGSALLPGKSRMGALAAAAANGPKALEVIELTPDDLRLAPQRFAPSGPFGNMGASFTWGFIADDPKDRPRIHSRTFRGPIVAPPTGAITGGSVKHESKTLTGFHADLHCGQLEPGGALAYTEVTNPSWSDDPFAFEINGASAHPYRYRYSTEGMQITEYNVNTGQKILNVRSENLPFCLCANPASVSGPGAFKISPLLIQFGIARGRYLGRPVRYFAGNDRLFLGGLATGFDPATLFFGAYFAGEHADGSREYGAVIIVIDDRGRGTKHSMGFYCKEHRPHHHHHHHRRHGHGNRHTEVVTSTDVHGEVHWKQVDYPDSAPAASRLPIITKATYEFGGKTIKLDSKWGFVAGVSCAPPPAPGGGGFALTNWSGPWRERRSRKDFKINMQFGEAHADPDMVSLTEPTVF